MARFFKIIILVIAFSCQPDPDPFPEIKNPDKESQLIGDWRYKHIIVEGKIYPFASSALTPSSAKAPPGGERAVLTRRSISFYSDHTYELKWNRSEYQLGTPETENYQPSFGNWQLNNVGDSLLQSKGLPYETSYALVFGDGTMRRTSHRYISENFPNEGDWTKGDTVIFTEVFTRID